MPHIDEHRNGSRFSVLGSSPPGPPAPELLPADPLAALSDGLVAFRFQGLWLSFRGFSSVSRIALVCLQVFWRESSVFCKAGQHAWAELFIIVEGKHKAHPGRSSVLRDPAIRLIRRPVRKRAAKRGVLFWPLAYAAAANAIGVQVGATS